MSERTAMLDALCINAVRYMAELAAKDGTFSSHQILRKVTHEQQQAYIDLLYSFRDTQGREPFDAAHQEIGRRILNIAQANGYERAPELDRPALTIFGTPTTEKFYRPKER